MDWIASVAVAFESALDRIPLISRERRDRLLMMSSSSSASTRSVQAPVNESSSA